SNGVFNLRECVRTWCIFYCLGSTACIRFNNGGSVSTGGAVVNAIDVVRTQRCSTNDADSNTLSHNKFLKNLRLVDFRVIDAGEVRAAEDVLTGALSNWEWVVHIAAIHILLNDGENIGVNLRNSFNDWRQVRNTMRWFDHDALSNGIGKWHVIFQNIEKQ